MSELEDKLSGLLSNPAMMQQIMGMAKMLSGQSQEAQKDAPKKEPPAQPQIPQLDPGMIQALSGIAGNAGIDRNQQTLLLALQPYLSRDRIQRLERAMGAAKMASAASVFLNSGGLRALTGR